VLAQVDPQAPLKCLHASRGKWLRAEPVAAMYQQGRVKHVDPPLVELEDEMCDFGIDGLSSGGSPDRSTRWCGRSPNPPRVRATDRASGRCETSAASAAPRRAPHVIRHSLANAPRGFRVSPKACRSPKESQPIRPFAAFVNAVYRPLIIFRLTSLTVLRPAPRRQRQRVAA
jgi:hypothetical protein